VNPIVIGGTGGSGTRAVAALFREAGWFMGTERNESEDAMPIALFDWRWGPGYVATGVVNEDMRLAFEAALEQHLGTADPPPERWGWKHPHSYLLLPFLGARFADLRFVHVIRDGRDMALSANQQQLAHYGAAALGPDSGTGPVEAVRFWAWANARAAGHGEQLGDRYLHVRLEDLCADPQGGAERILAFGGHVPENVAALAAAAVRAPASLGRWRTAPAELIDELEQAAGETLAEFGYPRAVPA
jgi:hypothetical protein